MTEQQRVTLAVVLCLGISGVYWGFFKPPEPPKKPKQTQSAAQTEDQGKSADAAAPASANKTAADDANPVLGENGLPLPVQADERKQIENDVLVAEVSNTSLALTRLELKKYEERPTKKGEHGPVSLVLPEPGKAPAQAKVELSLNGSPVSPLAFKAHPSEIVLSGSQEETELTVSVRARPGAYALDYEIVAINRSTSAKSFGTTVHLDLHNPRFGEGGMMSGPAAQYSGICQVNGDTERETLDDLLDDGPLKAPGAARWAGIDRQYFVVAVRPEKIDEGATCAVTGANKTVKVDYVFGAMTLTPGQTFSRQFTVYLGPKKDEALAMVSPELKDLVDYNTYGIPLGFIARPMVFALNLFHGWTASWGLAIIMLTLMVKLLLFPVTYKSAVSMRKMQMLKPELDKIKERHPDDREAQQLEQLKLYKEKGVNPLGGCLPMVLQMPVWLALYRSLWTAVDLYQESFLWLPDLTAKEPGFPFMALALGVVFLGQQFITPMTMDNQQAKMMRWVMPIMFTFFMLALPSGLVLYIFINSVLSILQQLTINRSVGKPGQAVKTSSLKAAKR